MLNDKDIETAANLGARIRKAYYDKTGVTFTPDEVQAWGKVLTNPVVHNKGLEIADVILTQRQKENLGKYES